MRWKEKKHNATTFMLKKSQDREEKDIAKKDFQHEENINAPDRMKEVN